MSEKLKPCPFCSGNDLTINQDRNEYSEIYAYHIHCLDCGCNGRNNYRIGWCESEDEAIEAWNTRAISSAQDVVDRVRKWSDSCAMIEKHFAVYYDGYHTALSDLDNYLDEIEKGLQDVKKWKREL